MLTAVLRHLNTAGAKMNQSALVLAFARVLEDCFSAILSCFQHLGIEEPCFVVLLLVIWEFFPLPINSELFSPTHIILQSLQCLSFHLSWFFNCNVCYCIFILKPPFFIHIASISLRGGFEGFSPRRFTCPLLSFPSQGWGFLWYFYHGLFLTFMSANTQTCLPFFPVLLVSGIWERLWPMGFMLVFTYTAFFCTWNRSSQKDLMSRHLKWPW